MNAQLIVARNMRTLCDQAGWSNTELAKRMTDAGCPINQSAIWKIEHGSPPRKITVDEVVALAEVFGLTVSDLLADLPSKYVRTIVIEYDHEPVEELATFQCPGTLVVSDDTRRVPARRVLGDRP